MNINNLILAFVILCTALSGVTFADSLPIKDGHYSGGPVFTINLTEKQQNKISRNYKPYEKLSLTKSQQADIRIKAKMKESPTKLTVIRPADTVGECTCGLSNIGLIISGGKLELPISYLVTDKEAKAKEIVD
jgi:hypothetical protein